MNMPNDRALTLYDLLARRWQAAAPVATVRFTGDGHAAAFATSDGAILLAAVPDAEPPDTRIRVIGDSGQTTLRPRTLDPAPLLAAGTFASGAAPLVGTADGFLVGAGDGRILRLGRDGGIDTLLTLGGAVTALAHASGATAAADADTLTVAGTPPRPHPGITALALSAGGRLAAADAGAVTLTGASPDRRIPLPAATRLVWHRDGTRLAAALGDGGAAILGTGDDAPARLDGFPAPVRDVAWSGPAGALVVSGAFRVAAWAEAPLPASGTALVTGQPGLVVVDAVAAHPTRPLAAAGYANGQVIIAQIGSRDELLLRQDGAAVTALAFSPDGSQLAIGDAAGGIAIAGFPTRMFK